MGKTTIDGLAVRSSEKRAGSSAQKKLVASTKLLGSGDPLMQKTQTEDFLDSVEELYYDDTETGASLVDDDASDWSEILEKMQEPKEKAKPLHSTVADEFTTDDDTDWLDDWGGKKDSDFELELGLTDTKDAKEDKNRVKKTRKRWRSHLRRNIIIAVIALLVVAGGALFFWGDGLISRLTGGRSGFWDTLSAIVSDEIPFDEDTAGRTNVLIFGTEGYNMEGSTGSGTHDGAQLTDSIMVVSFDQKSKDVALLSLPRDLKVPMACSAGKINEVFWCHNKSGDNEQAGAKALMEQVGDILGLEFQYYAHVNWASLVDIIDTIGGVTVTLDEDINDYYYTGAVAKAGEPITVNGEQALGLARARHGTTGGDFTRGNTQQKIVEAIVNKMVSNNVGASEALGLINILGDNLRSNFSADNIKAGLRLASGFNSDTIRQVPLVDYEAETFYVTTATINDISYVVPAAGENNYSQIREYVDMMLNNDPVKREDATFIVYNATGAYGVAGAEQNRLATDGFKVMGAENTDSDHCQEDICVYALNSEMPATQSTLEERYGIAAVSAEETPAELWAEGVDFVIVIGRVDISQQ